MYNFFCPVSHIFTRFLSRACCVGFYSLTQFWNNAIFLADLTHSCWHTCSCVLMFSLRPWCSVRLSSCIRKWFCNQRRWSSGTELFPPAWWRLLFFPFEYFSLVYFVLCQSLAGLFCLFLRSCRGLTTTLWCHMMSPLEQQGELCPRGTSAQHAAGFFLFFCFFLWFIFDSHSFFFKLIPLQTAALKLSKLIEWLIFLPSGTLLMFAGWNANETATCLLAWQPTTKPNLRAVATSGQTMPLLVTDPVN